MPWWWLWLTAGVHRAAFGPRESLVESLVGELVALSGANGMGLGGGIFSQQCMWQLAFLPKPDHFLAFSC